MALEAPSPGGGTPPSTSRAPSSSSSAVSCFLINPRSGSATATSVCTSLAEFDRDPMRRSELPLPIVAVAPGSLLILNCDEQNIHDAFETAEAPLSNSDIIGFCSQTSAYWLGLDVTKAKLVGRTNWRRQEKSKLNGDESNGGCRR
ncbi:unnamed protein product [Linum trigynum]|uniref:Ankyrin repeat domain-containing protein n=1 Tax=Linum trigynum TaxID=586398 RepID=A0AAV2EPG2_9ROSI